MKKFNLIIPDNKEKIWNILIEIKKETNINDTIIRLIEEEVIKIKENKK